MADRSMHLLRLGLVGAALLTLSAALIGACSGAEPPSPTGEGEVLDLDEDCQSAIDTPFLSEESFYLGETEGGSLYGPLTVSFLSDGRVFWRDQVDPVFGTFSCSGGEFTATLPEGDLESFTAEYDPEGGILTIDGRRFLPETDI